MFLLADLFPFLRRYRMPISRDRAVLYLMALMEVAMAVEVYSGHLISGTIVITLLVSLFVLREPLNWNQWLGSGCIVLGIVLLFLNKAAAPA